MEQLVTTSLELNEILLSIANSLNQAQQHLQNMPPYDEFGRPNMMYHLPYLDFNLVVTSSFEGIEAPPAESSNTKAVAEKSIVKPGAIASFSNSLSAKNMRIVFKPQTESSTKTTNINLMSTISGRFVAVMPNDGLPRTILDVIYSKWNNDNDPTYMRYKILVSLFNTAGEPCADQQIEFNFDEQATKMMNNIADNITIAPPKFSLMEGLTDKNGKMEMNISFPQKDFDNKYIYIIRINSGTTVKSISICKI